MRDKVWYKVVLDCLYSGTYFSFKTFEEAMIFMDTAMTASRKCSKDGNVVTCMITRCEEEEEEA